MSGSFPVTLFRPKTTTTNLPLLRGIPFHRVSANKNLFLQGPAHMRMLRHSHCIFGRVHNYVMCICSAQPKSRSRQ